MANREFMACSGQRSDGGKWDWGVCRTDNTPAWWRLKDKRGHQRKFPTYEKAETAALKLESPGGNK